MGESLLCVLFLLPLTSLGSGAETKSSSILQLSPGLHLSMPPSYNFTTGFPLSEHLMFTVATPTLDGAGLFFPILSSPSFKASSNSSSSFGYSLGFYLKPSEFVTHITLITGGPCADPYGCHLYLAVCAGSLGSMSNLSKEVVYINETSEGDSWVLYPYATVDGFAAPVWIANMERPVSNVGQASLMVQLVADSGSSSTDDVLELQLRDGENVVWRVRNANVMEMQDTGLLTLHFNSTNGSHLVWQRSPITDALLEGQSLAVGKELVSNDSSYVARMEKGGLVFYTNKINHFNREAQPPPYWAFPAYFQDAGFKSLNQLISSAPCSNSPAQLIVVSDSHLPALELYQGSCTNYSYNLFSLSKMFSWMNFCRLEGDGMLYSYAVSSGSTGSAASVTRSSLDLDSYVLTFAPLVLSWQECNVPMACGPFGVCTPGAEPLCSCPVEQGFEPVNSTNILQGCKRSIDLPNCTSFNGRGSTTDFVQLNSTASIFLFNEWTFNSTPGVEVNACKQSCSSDCLCNGFFYQMHTSSCFFIADAFSLITVVDTNYTPILQPFQSSVIHARDYFTFLKVAASEHETNSTRSAALIALIAIISSLMVVCLLIYVFRAKRNKTFVHTSIQLSTEESKELQDILPLLPSRYSYKELYEATEGFSKLLGAGGCGSVYAGVLPDGRKVAVKALQVVLQGTQHSKQFLAEIATIGRTNHHNIVHLVGFCWEVSHRLLIYEYVEKGSLDRWIFVKDSVSCTVSDTSAIAVDALFLDWKTRYNVALGIAQGLTYLHEECEKPILHFDIKPQNILLDNGFVAKLADFGMSRLIERDMSTVVTGMRGTPGYIAPEWSSHGAVSKKSDVYSMGMVLLEIVGGRKNLDFSLLNSSLDPTEQEAWYFPSWAAKKCEQGLTMELVDKRLHQNEGGGGFDEAQALKLIHTAFWCIQENPARRPNAPTVVQWLEGMATLEQPPFYMAVNGGRRPNQPISFIGLVEY